MPCGSISRFSQVRPTVLGVSGRASLQRTYSVPTAAPVPCPSLARTAVARSRTEIAGQTANFGRRGVPRPANFSRAEGRRNILPN